jgi:hypothetical protein
MRQSGLKSNIKYHTPVVKNRLERGGFKTSDNARETKIKIAQFSLLRLMAALQE